MKRQQFEQLVAEGLELIPAKFRRLIKNVAIVVEDLPTAQQLRRSNIRSGALLLGLYEGVPHTSRCGRDPVLPDKITIFQEPIEAVARTPEAIRRAVAETVWHEIGHYFGLSEHAVRRAALRKFRA